MKDKIKNGYFFLYLNKWYLKVGSRCYRLPLDMKEPIFIIMFKNIKEEDIKLVFKANGERVE